MSRKRFRAWWLLIGGLACSVTAVLLSGGAPVAWAGTPPPQAVEIRFTVGETRYVVDGRERLMDAAPFVSENRTYLRQMGVDPGLETDAPPSLAVFPYLTPWGGAVHLVNYDYDYARHGFNRQTDIRAGWRKPRRNGRSTSSVRIGEGGPRRLGPPERGLPGPSRAPSGRRGDLKSSGWTTGHRHFDMTKYWEWWKTAVDVEVVATFNEAV